jgi:hypothetical protein
MARFFLSLREIEGTGWRRRLRSNERGLRKRRRKPENVG